MDHSGYLLGKEAFDKEEYKIAFNLFSQNEAKDVLCSYGLYALTQIGYIENATQAKSIAQRMAQAIPLISNLANLGDAEAIFVLGVLNEKNIFVQGGKEEALRYYETAYAKGNLRAGFNLAVILQESCNDNCIKKAIKIYQSLIESNDMEAAVNLGCIYMDYKSFQSYSLAKKYFELAANRKNKIALFRLGVIYEQGLGVDKNLRKAADYFKLLK